MKYAQDQYTAKMLDLIVAGINAPFEFAYEFEFSASSYPGGISFVPVRTSISQGADVTASTFEKSRKLAEKRLGQLIDVYTDE